MKMKYVKDFSDGRVHIYLSKANSCVKTLCQGWVKSDSQGKRGREYFIKGVKQTTTAHLSNCPECIRLYLPIFRARQNKYLIKLESIIKENR